jgi:transposase
MSRKIKYDVNFKLQVVQQILKGKESTDSISFKYTIDDSLVKRWVHFYRIHGIDGLMPSNRHYSPEFKLEVVQAVKSKSLSLKKACRQFRISSDATLKRWLILFDSFGPEALRVERRGRGKPKIRTPAMPRKPKKPLTREEELLEELADLRAENAYLKKLQALIQSESGKEEKRKSSKN